MGLALVGGYRVGRAACPGARLLLLLNLALAVRPALADDGDRARRDVRVPARAHEEQQRQGAKTGFAGRWPRL
jgi:hypothetical protein